MLAIFKRIRPLQIFLSRTLPILALAGIMAPCHALAQDNTPVETGKYKAPIKVACVGDSITAGVGAGKDGAWPTQMQAALGDKWQIKNFGVSGSTLLQQGDKPYQKEGAFANAKAFAPDVVVIMLGTNDTKPQNWKFFAKEFATDLKDMVGQFAALPSKPRIFVCHPAYVAKTGNWGINDPHVLLEIPVIDQVCKDLKVGIIDVHGALKGKDETLPDNVHPNRDGAAIIAATVYKALTGKEPPKDATKPGTAKPSGK